MSEIDERREPKYMSIVHGIEKMMDARQCAKNLLQEICGEANSGQARNETQIELVSLVSVLNAAGDEIKRLSEEIIGIIHDIRNGIL